MKHLYINKEFFVLLFIFMLGLSGFLIGTCTDLEFSSLEVWLVYNAMTIGIMALAVYLNTKSPMCIMEYEDRFILQYEHKRLTFLKSDISALRYPVKHQRTLCYRFVIGNRYVLNLFGMWGNLRDTVCEWEREHGLPTYQDEPANNYKDGDYSFAFSSTLSAFMTDRRAIFILMIIPCIIRMVRPPFGIANVICLILTLCAVYVVNMYLTSFDVEDGVLTIKNTLIKRYNHSIKLSDIKWIMIAEVNMCIKLKDGKAIVVRYKLSKEQLQDFCDTFDSIGIPCIYRQLTA